MARVLIAGCGYVGAALGRALVERSHGVWGLRRRPLSLPEGIVPIAADLGLASSLEDLPPDLDYVFYMTSPGGSDDALYRAAYVQGLSNLLARPANFLLFNFVQKDFWSAVGDFDPLPYWRRLSIPALALFGAEDSNVPSAESAARLRALDKPNIRVIIYDGSGHALQDPPGQGDRLFRQDALQAVCDFIDAR